jgi:hypothetical protein
MLCHELPHGWTVHLMYAPSLLTPRADFQLFVLAFCFDRAVCSQLGDVTDVITIAPGQESTVTQLLQGRCCAGAGACDTHAHRHIATCPADSIIVLCILGGRPLLGIHLACSTACTQGAQQSARVARMPHPLNNKWFVHVPTLCLLQRCWALRCGLSSGAPSSWQPLWWCSWH